MNIMEITHYPTNFQKIIFKKNHIPLDFFIYYYLYNKEPKEFEKLEKVDMVVFSILSDLFSKRGKGWKMIDGYYIPTSIINMNNIKTFLNYISFVSYINPPIFVFESSTNIPIFKSLPHYSVNFINKKGKRKSNIWTNIELTDNKSYYAKNNKYIPDDFYYELIEKAEEKFVRGMKRERERRNRHQSKLCRCR